MKDEFVTFECARLLKKKGFSESTQWYWTTDDIPDEDDVPVVRQWSLTEHRNQDIGAESSGVLDRTES